MVKYNLDHLTQPADQNVSGPIQDDEALFLFSIIRGNRLQRVLEIGGLNGYSAKNFLEALSFDTHGILYTCDVHPVPVLSNNHRVLVKNALDITLEELDNQPLDLIFFDCHDILQMDIYHRFVASGIIQDHTILALHDTNLHYAPYHHFGTYIHSEHGYAHQPVERHMVNAFKLLGYDVFSIRTNAAKHSPAFPVRHGLTVCQKFKVLY